MNKSTIVAVIIFLGWSSCLYAQIGQQKSGQIQAQKIAFLTNKMNLTVEEAESFWPIYHEYDRQKKVLSEEAKSSITNPTDEEAKMILEKHLTKAEKEIALTRDFIEKASEVVSYRKLYELEVGEREFRLWILNRYKEMRKKN